MWHPARHGGNKGASAMTKTDLSRTVAALFCTVLMSATCILGAVAPAHQAAISTGSHQVV